MRYSTIHKLLAVLLFVCSFAQASAVCKNTDQGDITLNTIDSEEIDFANRSYNYITFSAKRSPLGQKELKLAEYVNGKWSDPIWATNPGKVTEKTILGTEKTVDYVDYSCAISPQATKIKFYTETGATLKKYIINIALTYEPVLEITTSDIDFGFIRQGEVSTRDIQITYAALPSNLTASVSGSAFTIDNPKSLPQQDVCSKTTTTLKVSFRPTELGVFSETLTFSNGSTVKLYGECSKNIETTLTCSQVQLTSARLAWTPVAGATAYRIVDKLSGLTYTVEKDVTQLNATGLQMGTTYEFVVYAVFDGLASLNHSNTVVVTTQTSDVPLTDCVIYQHDAVKSYLVDIFEERSITYTLPTDASVYTKRLEFEVKTDDGAYVDKDGDMGIYVLLRGETEYQKINTWSGASAGINDKYAKQVVEIPYNTVAIKFTNGTWNGSLQRYVRNLKVFKDNVLEVSGDDVVNQVIDFGEVEFGKSVTKEFTVTFANATTLSFDVDSRYYKITEPYKQYACDEGVEIFSITYTPDDCEDDYTAALTLFNGQQIALTLKGTVQKPTAVVQQIIWNGSASDQWDNRDNWFKTDGTPLTCMDVLADDLTVILPAPNSKQYAVPQGGIVNYPVIPDVSDADKFGEQRNVKWRGAQVNAGDNHTATKIASTIKMEYGASLVGVENLHVNGVSRYDEVETEFIARREDWLMVGTVVRPWTTDENGNRITRNIQSGDYYKHNLPHVYMHQAVIDSKGQATWNNSFADLGVEVEQDKVFAIRVPDQYGDIKLPALFYNMDNNTNYDPEQPIPFRFVGRFYNESKLPTYEGLTPHVPVMLVNTYPANMNVLLLEQEGYGTVQYYDYGMQSFVKVDETNNAVVPAQHGFVFTPNDGVTSLTVPKACMLTTSTETRSSVALPSLRLKITNDAQKVGSEVCLTVDAAKTDTIDFAVDAPKIYNGMNFAVPDLYIMRYGSAWSAVHVPEMQTPIPLGIRVNTSEQNFTISLVGTYEDDDVILEDRQTGMLYNLSAGDSCQISHLPVGDCEGRFYLYIEHEEDVDQDDIVSDVPGIQQESAISIYSKNKQLVVSSNASVQIQTILVTDMVGRSWTYTVNGRYSELSLPLAEGVYSVRVIGDNEVKTQKIRIG